MNKLPKKAKKVFTGVIHDTYQWQQKMFDGSYATFEMIKRQGSVVIIPVVKDKIVILKQKQPGTNWFYDVPAGRRDVPGETPRQTALRELKEETGLKPKKLKLWYKQSKSSKVIHNVYVYIAYDCEQKWEQSLDSGEKIQVKSVTFDQFLKLSDLPTFRAKELTIEMLRARLNPKKKKQLRQLFFPK